MSSYFSKYKRIITDTDTQTVNPTMKFNMTVEQYQDLMHHTHRASDILADDGTSVGASIQEITNSVEDLKTAIDANTEADETNVDAINEALDNLKNTLSEHSTESDERITAASDAIDELKKLISYNSSADETNAAAMEEALAAIKDLIQANTDNDAANLEATTNSIATLTALITENSNADEEQATSVAASLTELNGLIQANANKATEINGAIEVLGVKVQKNADDIADTEKVIVDITEENAVLKSTIAKIKAQLRQIMDNITEPKTTLPAADANGVITLDWDYAAPLTVAEGETVTLDLNGYNLDCDTGCTVINKGNLTIVGEGIVSCGASNSAAIANFPGATCTLEGGTFQSSAWYTIKNCGIMVIDGDVTITTNSDSNVSSLIDNGWYGSTDKVAGESLPAQANAAYLTIESGAFNCTGGPKSCSVVKNDDYGTLVINGGTFDSTANTGTSAAATIMNWNICTINDGTFIGQYPISNGYCDANADIGECTINGGTFIGTMSTFGQNSGSTDGYGTLTINGGTFDAPIVGNKAPYAIVICGGTFPADVASIVDTEKYDVTANSDGTYTVTAKVA